jgi:glycerate 2-kinase
VDVRTMPVADGGEGTVSAAVAAGFEQIQAGVSGPTGIPVAASIAIRDQAAVIGRRTSTPARRR